MAKQRLSEEDVSHINVLLWRVTQEYLAEQLNVSPGTLSNALHGRGTLPEEAIRLLRGLTRETLPKMRQTGKHAGKPVVLYLQKRKPELKPFYR